jgi:hypothetical protein
MSDTLKFFNENFSKPLGVQGLNDLDTARLALSKSYPQNTKKGDVSNQRITSGWAVIRQGECRMQFDMVDPPSGIIIDKRTRVEAFKEAIENLDGPVMLLEFSKSGFSPLNLRRTFDKRAAVVCSSNGFRFIGGEGK